MQRSGLFPINNFKRKFENVAPLFSLFKRRMTTPRKEETRLSTKLADSFFVLGGRRPSLGE
jgi:hypothetical protein